MVALKPTRAPALGDQLASVLRDKIVRRQLGDGVHLVEDALAAEYGVSRGPVRDALKQLERQGLAEARRRGYHVVGLSAEDLDDLYELREAIEIVAVRRAISRRRAEQIDRAWGLVEKMVACADRSDADQFTRTDMALHALFYEMAENRRLTDVWTEYAPVFASLMQLTVEEDVDLHPSAEDHARLLELIVEGDEAHVEAVLRDHLRGARDRMAHAVRGRDAVTGGERAEAS